MGDLLRVKRGLKINLPELMQGEFGYCTDTKELYIGGVNGNVSVSNADYVSVKKFGAIGDGVADDTEAIENAINLSVGKKIVFPNGTYLITRGLNITVNTYSLCGERNERGCNGIGQSVAEFSASKIIFRPVDNNNYLISRYDLNAPFTQVIGGFEHTNLTFDIGNANGFEFGKHDENNDGVYSVIGDYSGQKYITSVHFANCAFHATAADRSSTNEIITRSGKHMIFLTKAFETVIDNCSFYGGDTQIELYGCDRPVLNNTRHQAAHLPILMQASNTFAAQHSINNIQIEGWTFAPIVNKYAELSVCNARLEQNDGKPVGSGKLLLAETAIVTEGSNQLTFAANMTNKLFPYLSIIKVSDGVNSLDCLVTKVENNIVTVHERSAFTWSCAAASVYRIHGVGNITLSSLNASYVNVSSSASENCPAFVCVIEGGFTSIVNAMAQIGLHKDISSMIIGNKLLSSSYMQDYVMFSGCSPYILPDLNNPFVVCDNFYKLDKDVLSERQAIGNKFNELSVINRSWVLTPKTFSSSTNDCNLIPFVKVQGEVNTHETLWAWSLKSDKALILSDDTLPAHAGTFIKIRMKVKAKNINEKLSYQFTGSGGTAFVEKDISTSWDVVEIITGIPSVWQSENRKPYGSIGLSVKGNMFLAGVTIEELHDYTSTLPTPSYNYIGKTFYKINADGVADDYVVCVKNADNTYAWKTLLA